MNGCSLTPAIAVMTRCWSSHPVPPHADDVAAVQDPAAWQVDDVLGAHGSECRPREPDGQGVGGGALRYRQLTQV